MVEISKIQAMVAELTARIEALGDRLDDRVDPDDPEVAEELARLEAELAALEAEERRLDQEFDAAFGAADDDADAGDDGQAGGHTWDTSLSRDVGDFVDRLVTRVTSRLSDLGATGDIDFDLDLDVGGGGHAEPVEESVPHTGQPVRIRNQAGPIRVRPGPDGEVSVSARRRGGRDDRLEDVDLHVAATDAAVEITTRWPGRPWRRAVALDVTVPAGTEVDASSGGGTVRIDGIGGPAAARTGGGSIKTAGTAGLLQVQTGGGSIRSEDHDGPVEAKTGGGSIRVEGRLTDQVHAVTGGGSIRLDGIDGAVVDAKSGGGSVRAEGRPDGGSRLRSGGGSVRLRIAEDADVEVIGSGTAAKSTVPGVQASRRRLEGAVGDGSRGVVELRSGGGSVSVEPL